MKMRNNKTETVLGFIYLAALGALVAMLIFMDLSNRF